MSEHQRLKMLAKLLQTEELRNQTEVLACLREQGIDTTQSSVSKAIKYE